MAARVELREVTNEPGNRLLRIVRRGSGSVVTWRRAQIVLLSAQRMSPTRISEVVFTDRLHESLADRPPAELEALYADQYVLTPSLKQ